MTKKIKKGFTLTELIVVIAIIAILAAVLIPTSISFIQKAKISNDTTDVKNMNTVLNWYIIDNDIDGTKLEAPEVYAIVNSQEKNYTFIPHYKNGVFWYNQNNSKIEYSSEGIGGMIEAASFNPSSVEDIYGNGKLYLNSQGEIASFLHSLRNVSSENDYSFLKEKAKSNIPDTNLSELVSAFDPKTTLYINSTSGFTNVSGEYTNKPSEEKIIASASNLVKISGTNLFNSSKPFNLFCGKIKDYTNTIPSDLTGYSTEYSIDENLWIVRQVTDDTSSYFVYKDGENKITPEKVSVKKVVFSSGITIIPNMENLSLINVECDIDLPISVGLVMDGAFTHIQSETNLNAKVRSTKIIEGAIPENISCSLQEIKQTDAVTLLTENNKLIKITNLEGTEIDEIKLTQVGLAGKINASAYKSNEISFNTENFMAKYQNVKNIQIEYTGKDNDSCDIIVTAFNENGIILYLIITTKINK